MKDSNDKLVPYVFKANRSILELIRQKAKREGRKVSEVMRQLLAEYLKK